MDQLLARDIRIGCHTIAWRGAFLESVLKEARELGFMGVELHIQAVDPYRGREEFLKELIRANGLDLVAIYHSLKLCCPENLDLEMAEARRQIALGKCLGASMIVIGNPPGHRVHPLGSLDHLANQLNAIGVLCHAEGLRLTYQPHYGGPVERPEEVEELLAKTDPSVVGLCLDTAHVVAGGGNPAVLIERHAGRIPYIQLKDLRWHPRNLRDRFTLVGEYVKLTRMKDYRRAIRPLFRGLRNTSFPIFVELGRGCVDFSAFLRSLIPSGYQGWLTIELDYPSLTAQRSMRQCFVYLRKLIEKSDLGTAISF